MHSCDSIAACTAWSIILASLLEWLRDDVTCSAVVMYCRFTFDICVFLCPHFPSYHAGEGPIKTSADIYSFGVCALEVRHCSVHAAIYIVYMYMHHHGSIAFHIYCTRIFIYMYYMYCISA